MKTDIWLTPRECEVLGRLEMGESLKWIASSLGIGYETVRTLAHRSYRKLGVHTRYEAVAAHPHHKPTPSRACRVRVTFCPPTNPIEAPVAEKETAL